MPKVGMEPIRKAAVINAALECICESGVEAATLDIVAERAGCSKGVVAYYFKTKKGLMLEALKAFLSYYQKSIQSKITKGMRSEEMIQIVVDEGLPSLEGDGDVHNPDINVSDLHGSAGAMWIPPDKKARLFVQFFSRAMVDREFQSVIQDVYKNDITGIEAIINYGIDSNEYSGVNALKTAYGLLAMIVGLSFFRVTDVGLPGSLDNRVVCMDYLNDTLIKNH
ncbi:MAG: TetR family transcriptional regulator [Bacillota bacterium]